MSELHGPLTAPAATALSAGEAEAIATLGYIYGYPLVLMDATLAASVTPINQFSHAAPLPDGGGDRVSANLDMSVSAAWLDLGAEPLLLALPDFGRRYQTLQLFDGWTSVVASLGTRTSGNRRRVIAIVGPGWRGPLPAEVEATRAPTNLAWLVAHTAAAPGRDDDDVRALQRQVQLVPLSAWGQSYRPANDATAADADPRTPPSTQVDRLGAGRFFARLARLLKENPPAPDDAPIVHRLARLQLVRGGSFDLLRLPPSIVDAVEAGVSAARARLHSGRAAAMGKRLGGWRVQLDLGRYGTNHEQRAVVALAGLGAGLAEDAVQAAADTDGGGQPLSGAHRYQLRFAPGAGPPVNAFWSLTLYDDQDRLVRNPIGRHALGNRDPLRSEADGALEIVIQRDDPGPDRRANWLPAPEDGFNLILRLYHPKAPLLDGSWRPPTVTRV